MDDKKQIVLDFIKSWKPVTDRVVVLPDEQAKETESGIITSDTKQADDKRVIGTVVAVGSGRYSENGKLVPTEFKVGQKVLFSKYVGEDFLISDNLSIIKYDGVKREEEILVTIVRADSLLSILP